MKDNKSIENTIEETVKNTDNGAEVKVVKQEIVINKKHTGLKMVLGFFLIVMLIGMLYSCSVMNRTERAINNLFDSTIY